MGEYVGRIYDEVKHRPKYIIESAAGLDVYGEQTSRQAARTAETYGIDEA
jgi:hypothetical protein